MSVLIESKQLQRYELYVGVFRNQLWTSASLCDYFHRLIEGSRILKCQFRPCTKAALTDQSFAILTFASVSSVNECMANYIKIKKDHHLIVKRNLRETCRNQRPISNYILIHLDQLDHFFTTENVLNYFGKYGSIDQWRSFNNGRTFLLYFKDYDSVDVIFLDEPHFVNEQYLSIRKCYNPYNLTLPNANNNHLKEQICNLQTSIDRSKYSHESQLLQIKKQLQEEIIIEENHLSDITESYVRLNRIQLDLKQDLISIRQINQQLKKQIQQTIQNNKRIVYEFESQLEEQRFNNK